MIPYRPAKRPQVDKEMIQEFLNRLVKHPEIKKLNVPMKRIRNGPREKVPIFTLEITNKEDDYSYIKGLYPNIFHVSEFIGGLTKEELGKISMKDLELLLRLREIPYIGESEYRKNLLGDAKSIKKLKGDKHSLRKNEVEECLDEGKAK